MIKRLAASIAAVALLAAPTATAATTGTVDGAFFFNGTYTQSQFSSLCEPPNSCERIPTGVWPGRQAADALIVIDWLNANPDARWVVGHSYGAAILGEVLRHYEANGGAPEGVTFILLANPERTYQGLDAKVLPESSTVPVIDLAVQYDGFADWPNNPDSPYYWLAVTNAVVGAFTIHVFGYIGIEPTDPSVGLRWTEGNVTYVLVPHTPVIPVPQQWIEDAYHRPTGPVINGTTQEEPDVVAQEAVLAPVPQADQQVEPDYSERPVGGSADVDAGDAAGLPDDTSADATAGAVPERRRSERRADPGEDEPTDPQGGSAVLPDNPGQAGLHPEKRGDGVDKPGGGPVRAEAVPGVGDDGQAGLGGAEGVA